MKLVVQAALPTVHTVHTLAHYIGDSLCHKLTVLNALRGLDTVSCLICIGKVKPYKHAKSLEPINLKQLATISNVSANKALSSATKFIALSYDKKGKLKKKNMVVLLPFYF